MKKTVRFVTLLAGVLAAVSFSAMAQEKEKAAPQDKESPAKKEPAAAPEREAGRRGPGARRELTEEQRAEMAKQREKMAALRKEYDKDNDGQLNDDERKGYMEAVLILRFDENGDGKLEGDEKTKADEARTRFGNRGPGAAGRGPGGPRGGADGTQGRRRGQRQAPPQDKP